MVQCHSCNKYFHTLCVRKTQPYSDDQEWSCSECTSPPQQSLPAISSTTTKKLPRGVKIGHVNTRDFLSKTKKDDVQQLILNNNFHIFGVTETWLTKEINNEELQLPGYEMTRQDRPGIKSHKQRGGGLLLYTREDYEVTLLPSPFPPPVESIKVVLKKQHLPDLILILIYRVTTTPKSFHVQMEDEIANNSQSEFYMIGDFNIDQLKSESSEFKSAIRRQTCKQLITQPTRVTTDSKSLIDLIVTNRVDLNKNRGIIHDVIADHEIIYTIRKTQKHKRCPRKAVTIRSFKDTNEEKLNDMVKTAPWWILDFQSDMNLKCELFNKLVTLILNIHAPFKTFRVRVNKKPWMTVEYEQINKNVERAKKDAHNSGCEDDFKKFKEIRIKATSQKFKLKALKIKQQASESDNSSKFCWKMLNTEIGRIKTYRKLRDLFHNGEFIKNERHKLDILCQHFANPDLPQPQQPNTPPHHPDTPEGELLTNIRISAEEVKRAIIKIKANKPSGCDGIPPKFLRISPESISLPLSMLYNELMEAEMIPSVMKETIIYPLYKKKGAKNCVKNYRPISILPATSKILEKIIYDRIHMYTDKYDKLCNEQHGYRSKRSTLSATLVLTDAIREAGERRQMTGVALIDFEKAFESFAYPILLNKLQQLGITGKVFQWFKSYFEERTITVQRGKHKSAPIRLLRGTPTGSSLSGLIFSCYINDFPKIFKHCKCVLYADDACLYYSGNNVQEIQDKLNEDLNLLLIWCHENGMKINLPKTKAMLFRPTNIKPNQNLSIKIDECDIELITVYQSGET
ncbi:uncharacterized protein LOC118433119 [Folsomia candida]|uniref:uncharacterized protein LOC118433119 n=1 Tax=Folsomia candida TaxID=158441 RepID=UPI0016052BBE|nr:uncharacterized protein LOC118433119 [Folsomia candida]